MNYRSRRGIDILCEEADKREKGFSDGCGCNFYNAGRAVYSNGDYGTDMKTLSSRREIYI